MNILYNLSKDDWRSETDRHERQGGHNETPDSEQREMRLRCGGVYVMIGRVKLLSGSNNFCTEWITCDDTLEETAAIQFLAAHNETCQSRYYKWLSKSTLAPFICFYGLQNRSAFITCDLDNSLYSARFLKSPSFLFTQRVAVPGGGDGPRHGHVLSLPAGQNHEELPAATRGVSRLSVATVYTQHPRPCILHLHYPHSVYETTRCLQPS